MSEPKENKEECNLHCWEGDKDFQHRCISCCFCGKQVNDAPQTPDSMEDYSVAGFIREYVNNHNGSPRWLRGVFIDEQEKIDKVLEYMQKIEDKVALAHSSGRREGEKRILDTIKWLQDNPDKSLEQ